MDERQYSLPEDKNRAASQQKAISNAMGGTKAVISKHKGWMTIDLEAQEKKVRACIDKIANGNNKRDRS